MFYLEHGFWKAFYQRMAWQNDLHQKAAPGIDNIANSPPARSNLSIFLLPMDALGLPGHLSSFQYEMLEQSLMAMFKGFYNLEQKEIRYQKKSFREALIYSRDLPVRGYDLWINHHAQLIFQTKIKTK